jgi:hypothetical protein
MALLTDKFLFMHIPKTGGSYIRKIIDLLCIKGVEKDLHHNCFPELLNHISLDILKDKTVICFIRHPLTWYQSRWAFRLSHHNGWQGNNLDFACASNDFNLFVNNCIDYAGDGLGWASKKMNKFTDNIPSGLKTFIGKQEKLRSDLITALIKCKAVLPDIDFPSAPKSNVALNDGKPAHAIAKYDLKTYERVLRVDGEFIKKHYKNEKS